jgi:predicted RNA binding protein YcfA (HicA-like mRNA interferase family)
MSRFPSMKGKALRRLLERAPLSYMGPSTGSGSSHTKLVSTSGYPDLLFSFHDNADIAPGLVRKILVKDVGLTEDEALRLAGGG